MTDAFDLWAFEQRLEAASELEMMAVHLALMVAFLKNTAGTPDERTAARIVIKHWQQADEIFSAIGVASGCEGGHSLTAHPFTQSMARTQAELAEVSTRISVETLADLGVESLKKQTQQQDQRARL